MNETLPESAEKMTDILDIEGIALTNLASLLKAGLLILLVLIFCLLLYFLVKKILKWRAQNRENRLSPYKRALLDLERLQKQKCDEREEWQRYYFFLTEIFKRYVHNQFHLDVLEKTNVELKADLAVFASLSANPNFLSELEDFLDRSDLFKFAKLPSSQDQSQKDCDWLRDFVVKSHNIVAGPPS